jgi:hypothetical protein
MPKKRKSRSEKPLEDDRDAEKLTTKKLVKSYELYPLDDYVDVTELTKRQRQSTMDDWNQYALQPDCVAVWKQRICRRN